MSLREMLSDYWYAFQQELFPRLEGELGPMGVVRRAILTPPYQAASIAYRADRRATHAPNNTLGV